MKARSHRASSPHSQPTGRMPSSSHSDQVPFSKQSLRQINDPVRLTLQFNSCLQFASNLTSSRTEEAILHSNMSLALTSTCRCQIQCQQKRRSPAPLPPLSSRFESWMTTISAKKDVRVVDANGND